MRFFAAIIAVLSIATSAKADGAFVYAQIGRSWIAGFAYNRNSPQEAQAFALNQCRNNRGARHCILRTTFKNTCFALAVQQNNSGFGSAMNHDMNVASQQALEGCRKYGTACVVKASLCDGAPLTIKTEPGLKYLVKLVSIGDKREPIQIFVEGGQQYSTNVQLGTYNIRIAAGSTWYGDKDLFGTDTRFFRLRTKDGHQQVFELSQVGDTVHGMTISLERVAEGNIEEETISRSDFEN